ncbi:hypothetical protein FW774_17710 [Pedobacter sp. BS3]|uniref:hypothetical protein n=1 Tax=Pedobacter sp. BS3 TaxID=2567937 RepID=UPI0011ED0269|nr:hypothetical protein [Pedobacter sp. BS3]TZF81881.1 hypothetical protein FW774_17710 [Pedobacter sp. BS3]
MKKVSYTERTAGGDTSSGRSHGRCLHRPLIKPVKPFRQLLRSAENRMLLKEVTMKIGYQNPSYSAAAFKAFYGFHPSRITYSKETADAEKY